MLELNQIAKRYGGIVAFEADSLKINNCEIVGLVGNNGAGKTTMLRLILDLIKPEKGHATSKKVTVAKSDHWKSYTGSFLDEGFLIPFLKPLEYMEFLAALSGYTKSDLNQFLSENTVFIGKDLFKDRKLIRDLSTGNKTKVGILGAILHKPEILILDEPFANLDPGSQSWLKWKLEDLNREGTTMIISSHDLKHIAEVATRVIILEEGKIVEDRQTSSETLLELETYFNRVNDFSE